MHVRSCAYLRFAPLHLARSVRRDEIRNYLLKSLKPFSITLFANSRAKLRNKTPVHKMFRVRQCCCGCSLQNGCKIIAVLGLSFGGGGLLMHTINFVGHDDDVSKINDNIDEDLSNFSFTWFIFEMVIFTICFISHAILCWGAW